VVFGGLEAFVVVSGIIGLWLLRAGRAGGRGFVGQDSHPAILRAGQYSNRQATSGLLFPSLLEEHPPANITQRKQTQLVF
jgi:hypothetical protein